MFRLVALACFLGSLGAAFAQSTDTVNGLFKWIEDLGGKVNVEVRVNSNGVRGLYAVKAIPANGLIASIPAATIMNAASLTEGFSVSLLTVLRELKDPHSRFKPYMDTLPRPNEINNECNIDPKYAPMFKDEHWAKDVLYWNSTLHSLLNGELDMHIEYTIREMVGNAEVTIEDLKYACAIAYTRSVTVATRKRMMLIPVFDLANHERHCPNYFTDYDEHGLLPFLAGKDIEAGEEICYAYGDMRDDYAVIAYGFLPTLEDPPRLALVDHRDYTPSWRYNHEEAPSDTPISGDHDVLKAELLRLEGRYEQLKSTPDSLPPQPKGVDYMYDLLKELEQRRLNAMAYEIRRLEFLLGIDTNSSRVNVTGVLIGGAHGTELSGVTLVDSSLL